MAAMTDPAEAMRSFQQALAAGQISLQKGDLDPSLFLHADQPNGNTSESARRLFAISSS
jgi:hypothetical protein